MGLMDKQTQLAFALGGLNDEGGEIDEVSGNSVPIGGTKEGVRDDIPANVSEGEFIFPADVVRYHGLDKMMALRQEAKTGLKRMESMGQMGNSEEATMPDDLPFSMDDLIVVGGQGEPMEFNEGGFVPYTPKFEDLKIADVPMMAEQAPISYEGYTSPKVTMKEFRNEEGEAIFITYINGVGIVPVPKGYTLYIPPEKDTEEVDEEDAVQTAIENVNNYGDDSNDTVEQAAPDYTVMNDNEFFAYMTERNSFGGKAGKALALTVGSLIPIPGVGLLTLGAMKNHENNLMANMKSRIDRMPNGPQKIAALASYKEYSGEIDPTKKTGLLNKVTDFVMGLAIPLANALGINPQVVTKTAKQAAVAGVSGAGTAIETAPAPATQTQQAMPTGPQGTAIGAFTNQDPRQPTAFPGMGARVAAGNIQTVSPNQQLTLQGAPPITSRGATAPQPAPLPTGSSPSAPFDTQTFGGVGPVINLGPKGAPLGEGVLTNIVSNNPERVYNPTSSLGLDPAPKDMGYDETGINVQPPQPPQPTEAEKNYAKFQRDQEYKKAFTAAKPNLVRENEPDYTSLKATQQRYGPSQRAGYESDMYAAMQDMAPVNYVTAPGKAGMENRVLQKQPQSSVKNNYDETGVQMQDSRDNVEPRDMYQGNMQDSRDNVEPRDMYQGNMQVTPTVTQQNVVPSGASGEGYGIGQVDPRLATAVQTQQAFSTASQGKQIGSPNVEPRDMYQGNMQVTPTVTQQKETPVQRRAKEAVTQRANMQTTNAEIAKRSALIPARIKNSSYYADQVRAGYTGSTTAGYAIGKIAGSDGDSSGVVQGADGKVQKVRDLQGYKNLKGTQRGAMTVFQDSKGKQYVKGTTGKLTNLDGSDYKGSGDGSSSKSGDTGSGRSKSDIQADINKAQAEVGAGNWSSELNDLVAERDNSSDDNSSNSSSDGGFLDNIADAWNDFWSGDDDK